MKPNSSLFRILITTVTLGIAAQAQAQTTLTNGLVAYFPFDGNANDLGACGNSGTVQGASLTSDRFGVTNGAYHFDPSGYIAVPSSPCLKITGTSITLASWVKPSQFSGVGNRRTILRKMSQADNVGGYLLALSNDGHISFAGRFGFNIGFDLTARFAAVPTNTWSHVAVEFDGTNIRYFLNGLLADTIPLTGSITADDDALAIGRLSASYDSEHFYGDIEEIRIYNRNLSVCELQQLASLGLEFGLVAHYPFDGNANDTTTNRNDGTLSGTVPVPDRFGRANSAYYFNGSAYIKAPHIPAVDNLGDSTTLSAWIKIDPNINYTVPDIIHILSKGATFGQFWSDFALQLGNPNNAVWPLQQGSLVFENSSAQNSAIRTNSTFSVPEGAWHHVAVTFTSGLVRFYLDGSLGGVVRSPNEEIRASDEPLYIGVRLFPEGGRGTYFRGSIDEVRIYDRALSDFEVQQLSGPRVALIKALKPSFANLAPGTSYQLQVSPDFETWANAGAPFVATCANMAISDYWDVEVWGNLFFRLQVVP